jgi:hypothetical protein
VLGVDRDSDLLVGFDPRRLEHGGTSSNATNFFDVDALELGLLPAGVDRSGRGVL